MSPSDLPTLFRARDVRYVRVQWVDLCNQVRCRILSPSYFLSLLNSYRAGVTLAKAALGIVALHIAPGFSGVGEYIFVFDLSSFRTCSYAPNHAVFLGFFQEQLPLPSQNPPSFHVPFCPRTLVSRLVRHAASDLGIQFLVGFESEFILLKSTDPFTPVHIHQWSAVDAVTTGSVEAQVLEEIADAIQADGIVLQMYHAEAAPGQYEVVTGPLSPLRAADALLHTRQTIYNIATKHGLTATFAPRIASDSCGSGAHMHISVRRDRPDIPASDVLTSVESAFLSGLMHHLHSILALTLPLSASYARMADGIWSGGTWLSWGIDNRETPVRLTKASSPSSRNFEIRPIDGTSNPYLALAGVLACGILGVRGDLPLAVKNCGVPPAEMTVAEREALGITKRLPLNIGEARQCLTADDAIKDVLGVELVEHYVNLNQMLASEIDRRDGESESQAVARLVQNF